MRTAFITTASLASVLFVLAASATAHEMAAGPSKASANCPPPKPVVTPAHHRAHHHCVGQGQAAHHNAWRSGRRFAHGRYDHGVAPSQAFVYGEEKERDRHDMGRQGDSALGAPPCARACPPMDHHRFMSERDAHSWSSERRESENGGFVRGERDGHRYGWSWGAGATGCDPHGRRLGSGGADVYRYAGRDENGYLVWPGKTPRW